MSTKGIMERGRRDGAINEFKGDVCCYLAAG